MRHNITLLVRVPISFYLWRNTLEFVIRFYYYRPCILIVHNADRNTQLANICK